MHDVVFSLSIYHIRSVQYFILTHFVVNQIFSGFIWFLNIVYFGLSTLMLQFFIFINLVISLTNIVNQ